MQILQWCPVKGNTPPTTSLISLHFPRSFPFCLFPNCCLLCSVGTSYGGPELLCHRDLFKRVVRLMIVNYQTHVS